MLTVTMRERQAATEREWDRERLTATEREWDRATDTNKDRARKTYSRIDSWSGRDQQTTAEKEKKRKTTGGEQQTERDDHLEGTAER